MCLARPSPHSIVSLEWAGPGVGGGIVFPLSVSVGFALELLFSDILIGVVGNRLLLDLDGVSGGDKSDKDGVFHHCGKFNLLLSFLQNYMILI